MITNNNTLKHSDCTDCWLPTQVRLNACCFAEWWYGETVCRWVPYLQGVAVGASVNTLAAVAVERCVVGYVFPMCL